MRDDHPLRPEERTKDSFGQPDPFTAGDAILERAKTVAQRIRERVRRLIQKTQFRSSDDSTTESPEPAS